MHKFTAPFHGMKGIGTNVSALSIEFDTLHHRFLFFQARMIAHIACFPATF
ncbi:hypothetical protein [Bacillus sp. MCCB 382]|uniref:hypothetical protein n=1 Tax=Bacillus sp. MCCB 382 TaxID=2860197 RepID=UPI0027D789E7